MPRRIVVLGGGTAGTMVANRLARRLTDQIRSKEVEILLITNTEKHIYQPGYLSIVFNEQAPEHFIREEKDLIRRDVHLIVDEIQRIEPEQNRVLSDRAEYPYDYLVIATGSRPDFGSVPGLRESAHNFYTLEGAIRLRDTLAGMKRGRILITVDIPHKCPAAPLEIALMLDDYFRRRGVREQVEIKYTYPIGRIHALESVAEWALPRFEERDILHETFFNLERVDPERKAVITMDGEEHPFDVLISVPAHKGAQVILDSGIGDGMGFVPTDRHSLKMKGFDNVYAIGDATDLPISKAGSTAHYQSEPLIRNLVSRLRGLPETAVYDGKVACFLENSLRDASFIVFDYEHPPKPAAASELLHWMKMAYGEIYWLNVRGIL
ncbi:MAG: pyridine nucleotide-disulfide oxidoreductase [Thermoactinomycetaceae bacterium]|nr:pyridine nucleotide-disulfide oxidoreductase [Thermoactinomycetaceae bacterium]